MKSDCTEKLSQIDRFQFNSSQLDYFDNYILICSFDHPVLESWIRRRNIATLNEKLNLFIFSKFNTITS